MAIARSKLEAKRQALRWIAHRNCADLMTKVSMGVDSSTAQKAFFAIAAMKYHETAASTVIVDHLEQNSLSPRHLARSQDEVRETAR